MSYFNRIFALAAILVLLMHCFAQAQSPPIPGKSPEIPGKSTPAPLASPQAAYATPQQSFAPAPQYDQPAVVLQAAPQIYAVQRQVVVQAAPVVAYASVAYDPGCAVVQQQVVQRAVVHHQAAVVQRNVFVQHAAVARAPRKVVTKSKTVTRTKRGLFGRG